MIELEKNACTGIAYNAVALIFIFIHEVFATCQNYSLSLLKKCKEKTKEQETNNRFTLACASSGIFKTIWLTQNERRPAMFPDG